MRLEQERKRGREVPCGAALSRSYASGYSANSVALGWPGRPVLDRGRFVRFVEGRRTALVLEDGGEEIRAALLEGAGCVPLETEGRGRLLRFPYKGGYGLIRTYLRGGVVRHFLKDRYLLDNRPFRELALHSYAYEKGLSVPKPLGVCWERNGPWFRGAIAAIEVDAINLLDYLRTVGSNSCSTVGQSDRSDTSDRSDLEATLRDCGLLIRRMHDLGIWHADLQLRNILVGVEGPLLIDLDKARVRGSLGSWRRARNLLRLRRSFQKWDLPDVHFQRLCHGYGMEELPALLDRLYRAKGVLSDVLSGRRQ